ncbi:hypothetical protein GWK16_23855 [Roseomonas sp. JC162]|uniref:Uncharacterized protein n=2 Tax=Neoroseomonas marina TaxID=1232220 RepID=A0A848ELQ9_9PROT|nr:hypothetical protein [Neoroseomonas marina]
MSTKVTVRVARSTSGHSSEAASSSRQPARARTRRAIGPMMPVALATMVRLLNHKSGFVQHQAAADLLDRGGFRPPERHQHAVVGKVEVDIRLTDD